VEAMIVFGPSLPRNRTIFRPSYCFGKGRLLSGWLPFLPKIHIRKK
jgi:hypothetical protein